MAAAPGSGSGSWMAHLPRIQTWTRAVVTVGAGNLLCQVLAFLAGILILRMLSVEQYALYTLAYAMLGTLSVLGDCGINVAATGEGGKVWQDRDRLGAVIATAKRLRWRFAVLAFAVAPFILPSLLQKHGAVLADAALVIGCILLLFTANLKGALLGISLQLHQRNWELQRLAIVQGVLRLGLLGLCLYLSPFAFVALAVTLAAQFAANFLLRRSASEFADLQQTPDPSVQRSMAATIRRVAPGAIYHAFAAQLMVWLIALFGNTGGVAEIGALGRLGQLMLIGSALVTALFVPRFARLPLHPHLLFRRYFQALGAIALLAGAIFAVVALFPQSFLRILGASYQGLHTELLILMAGAGLHLVGGAAYNLAACRGWVVSGWVAIPVALATQAVLIAVLDVATVRGCLWLGLLGGIPPYLLCIGYAAKRARRDRTAGPVNAPDVTPVADV